MMEDGVGATGSPWQAEGLGPGKVDGRPVPADVALTSSHRTWRTVFVRRWAVALTVLLALLFAVPTVLTLALRVANPLYVLTNPVVDLAFFALGGILITAGVASQIRGQRVAGLQGAVLALLALSLAGWWGGRIEPAVGPLVLLTATAPLVALHPDRSALLRQREGLSRPLLLLALLAAAPAFGYASAMLALARTSGPSCFLGQCVQGDRLAEAAALAIAVVLLTLLASWRTPGWWVPARSAATGAILLGGASLAFPAEVGALGKGWAIATVLWGVVAVVVVQVETLGGLRRQDRR
jgi:hypothetical protein